MNEPFRIPCEQLRIKKPITAGMNPLVVMSLTYMLRTGHDDPPPIRVVRDGDGWLIQDGRHRFFAAVIAGRPDILAVEELDKIVAIGERTSPAA